VWSYKIEFQVELRGRLELEDIISVLQRNRLRWYGHVLRKGDNDWVKKCMEYKVEGTRPRGRPKKTWREIVEKDCRASGLNTDDAMCRSRWRKQIEMIDDHDECGGWMFLLVPAPRVVPDKFHRAVKRLCVCVCLHPNITRSWLYLSGSNDVISHVTIQYHPWHFLDISMTLPAHCLSRAVFEIMGLKDIGVTTLTLEGHVTSSMTSSFDPA